MTGNLDGLVVGVCECGPVGEGTGDLCVCAPKEGGTRAIAIKVATKDGEVGFESTGVDLQGLHEALKGRGNIVMTRVADEDLATMDLLVESGLFGSRSECAAFLIRAGIEGRKDLLERVKDTAGTIRALKEKMRKDIAS